MKVCVLASGSKGNVTYIETEKTKSLIDIGMSCAYVEKNLKDIGVDPKEIQRIFITLTGWMSTMKEMDWPTGMSVPFKKTVQDVFG